MSRFRNQSGRTCCLNCSADLEAAENQSAFYTLNCSSRVRSPLSPATVELIPVPHALATIFNFETLEKVSKVSSYPLKDFESSASSAPICFTCYLVLSDLYRIYTEFSQLRKANSFLGSKLKELENYFKCPSQSKNCLNNTTKAGNENREVTVNVSEIITPGLDHQSLTSSDHSPNPQFQHQNVNVTTGNLSESVGEPSSPLQLGELEQEGGALDFVKLEVYDEGDLDMEDGTGRFPDDEEGHEDQEYEKESMDHHLNSSSFQLTPFIVGEFAGASTNDCAFADLDPLSTQRMSIGVPRSRVEVPNVLVPLYKFVNQNDFGDGHIKCLHPNCQDKSSRTFKRRQGWNSHLFHLEDQHQIFVNYPRKKPQGCMMGSSRKSKNDNSNSNLLLLQSNEEIGSASPITGEEGNSSNSNSTAGLQYRFPQQSVDGAPSIIPNIRSFNLAKTRQFKSKEKLWNKDQQLSEKAIYECPEPNCASRFTLKSSLQRHFKEQHTDFAKEFTCPFCSKEFTRASFGKKHKARCEAAVAAGTSTSSQFKEQSETTATSCQQPTTFLSMSLTTSSDDNLMDLVAGEMTSSKFRALLARNISATS